MTLPPGLPIVFLILGALAIGASELAQLRRPTAILIITTLLSIAALWTVHSETPVTQIIAAWQPVSVFTVPLSFRVDQTAWLLALGLLWVLLTAALTWVAFPGRYRPAPRAVALLLVAAALAGIFASNLLTLAVAWLFEAGTRWGSSSITSTRYSGASVGKAERKLVSTAELE